MDETGLLYACVALVCLNVHTLTIKVECHLTVDFPTRSSLVLRGKKTGFVKKQPSQDVLHGDAAEEELGLARLVSSYTLPHQNSQPGKKGQQTARSKVLSRHARDT